MLVEAAKRTWAAACPSFLKLTRLNTHSSVRAATSGTGLRPLKITLHSKERRLEVQFSDGCTFSYPAEFLRVQSPSAGSGRPGPHGRFKVVTGRRYVGILGLEPVGSYALRYMLIKFDDLHDSGIFSYDFLHQLGQEKLSRMRSYIHRLQKEGLSRDPPARQSATA